jgi:hypothetical protein
MKTSVTQNREFKGTIHLVETLSLVWDHHKKRWVETPLRTGTRYRLIACKKKARRNFRRLSRRFRDVRLLTFENNQLVNVISGPDAVRYEPSTLDEYIPPQAIIVVE